MVSHCSNFQERRLYKPPENVVDSNALIKPFPSITDESPLGALQRSMGLKRM